MGKAPKAVGYKPEPYWEEEDPDVFWEPDPCDDMLPDERGFLSDVIYHTRGREVPSLFMIWSSLFAICSVVKRDAWLKWADGKLFSNIYAMVCAPPGAAKKNTSIDMAINLMDYLDLAIEEIGGDDNVVRMKRINPFHSKATPEALVSMMVPENRRGEDFDFEDHKGNPITGADGKVLRYYKGSELAICQHEMAALIGKQSYMEGIMEMLLNFYDCHDRWSYVTQGRGQEELQNIFVSFLAALTPTTLKASLPDAATGDGFMSRCMVVYQSFTERRFHKPIIPDGAPDKAELRRRLAWIAANTFGEWEFTPEADAWIQQWYKSFKDQLSIDGMYMGLKSRWDMMLYKLAMLIRWQRYERKDRLITVQDCIDAEHILRRTFQESAPIYRMILATGMSDRGLKVEEYLAKVGEASRSTVIKNVHVAAVDLDPALELMIQEGRVEVWIGATKQEHPRGKSNEVYRWIGDVEKVKRTKTSANSQPVVEVDATEAMNEFNRTEQRTGVSFWSQIQRAAIENQRTRSEPS